jgi:hypothetical protein
MKKYEGGCHCRRIRFRVTADLADVTICNCSICSMKGYYHLIVDPKEFELLQGEEEITVYEFNTKAAKHRFCKVCGVQPFYTPRSDPNHCDVNARCLDDFENLGIVPKYFDGINWEESMAKGPPWRKDT